MLLAAGAACFGETAVPRLIPFPQQVRMLSGEVRISRPLRIRLTSTDPADRHSAQLLANEYGGAIQRGHGAIVMGRTGDAEIRSALARAGVDPEALKKDESYALFVDNQQVVLAAGSAPGLFYATQTLRQLLHSNGSGWTLPALAITDWPALRYRGIFIDIGRGALPTEAQFERIIRTAAEYKLNLVGIYYQHLFELSHAPEVTPEGGRITPDQVKRLVEYARRFHIDIVPEQQTFGHLHAVLRNELFSDLAETPHGSVLAESPAAYAWIEQAGREVAAAFKGPFLHIGADETFEMGTGRSKELAEKTGIGKLYFNHVRRTVDLLKPTGKQMMMWGDIAMNHPDLVKGTAQGPDRDGLAVYPASRLFAVDSSVPRRWSLLLCLSGRE